MIGLPEAAAAAVRDPLVVTLAVLLFGGLLTHLLFRRHPLSRTIETSGQLWPVSPNGSASSWMVCSAASSRLRRRVEPATAIAGTLTQLRRRLCESRDFFTVASGFSGGLAAGGRGMHYQIDTTA
jgi:hypothetical protein